MKTLKVQEFLRRFSSGAEGLKALEDAYGIKSRASKRYPNLHSLKYDMINSPMGERIVQECRGIIVDDENDFHIVARPFDKFFNYGESLSVNIDWNTAKVYEKLDGSLMILYHYDGAWQVASSGTPDAGGNVHNSLLFSSFSELFWHTYNVNKLSLPADSLQDWTFMFELMTPHNRVVVPHEDFKLALLGVRHRITGDELHLSDLKAAKGTLADFVNSVPHVKEFSISTHEEMMATIPNLDPMDQEGYVVCDAAFNRIKIKTPAYVAVAHMRDNFGPIAAIEIVRQGETSEVGTYYPAYQEILDELRDKFNTLVDDLEKKYAQIQHISCQKEFALEAVRSPFSDCLFALRKGKTPSVVNYLRNCRVERLRDLFYASKTNS